MPRTEWSPLEKSLIELQHEVEQERRAFDERMKAKILQKLEELVAVAAPDHESVTTLARVAQAMEDSARYYPNEGPVRSFNSTMTDCIYS